jgi:hypothetical protein
VSSVAAVPRVRPVRRTVRRRKPATAANRVSTTWGADLALSVLMFLFLFNVSFIKAPSATTGRLVLLFVLPFCARATWRVLRDLLRTHGVAMLVFVLVFAYAVVLYVLSTREDTTQLSRLFHFALYSIVGAAMFAALLRRNLERFLWIYTLATLLQACFIGWSFVSPPYRWWLAQRVVQGGLIPLMSELQAPGFSNSSGAWLSLIQGLGVFTALYGVRLTVSGRRTLFLYGAAILTGASTLVTGRTGIIVAAGTFVFFAVASRLKQAIRLLVISILLAAILWPTRGLITRTLTSLNPRFGSAMARGLEIFAERTNTDSFRALVDQRIPPITTETIIGTGKVAGVDENASGSDSGYVQTYYALGLLVATIFYVTLLGMLTMMMLEAPDRAAFAFAVVFLFIVEVKEPFIFKYDYPFLLFGMAFCFPKPAPRRVPLRASAGR